MIWTAASCPHCGVFCDRGSLLSEVQLYRHLPTGVLWCHHNTTLVDTWTLSFCPKWASLHKSNKLKCHSTLKEGSFLLPLWHSNFISLTSHPWNYVLVSNVTNPILVLLKLGERSWLDRCSQLTVQYCPCFKSTRHRNVGCESCSMINLYVEHSRKPKSTLVQASFSFFLTHICVWTQWILNMSLVSKCDQSCPGSPPLMSSINFV